MQGLPWWLSSKKSTCNAGDAGSISGSGRCPGEGNTPVFLPGKSHGQRSLVGYSPWIARVRHNLATKPPPSPETRGLHKEYSQLIEIMPKQIGLSLGWKDEWKWRYKQGHYHPRIWQIFPIGIQVCSNHHTVVLERWERKKKVNPQLSPISLGL